MKRALATILIPLALAGCRVAVVPLAVGRSIIVGSCLTDPAFSHVEYKADGSFALDGYQSYTNAEAVRNVVEGAVRAVIRP